MVLFQKFRKWQHLHDVWRSFSDYVRKCYVGVPNEHNRHANSHRKACPRHASSADLYVQYNSSSKHTQVHSLAEIRDTLALFEFDYGGDGVNDSRAVMSVWTLGLGFLGDSELL